MLDVGLGVTIFIIVIFFVLMINRGISKAIRYTGIGWVLGKFDRGWTERSVYGKIRCMTTDSTKRKYKTKRYVEKYSNPSSIQMTLQQKIG